MRKTIYIVLAVLIAAGLTVAQAVIARTASRGNEVVAYIAAEDLKKGTILDESYLAKTNLFFDSAEKAPTGTALEDLVGMTLIENIDKGGFITVSSVYDRSKASDDERFMAFKVEGSNFNAGCMQKGDIVDIFFIPDFDKLENYQIVWLNEMLIGSTRFIKGKSPGILVRDLVINHISKTAGDQAEYISVRVPKPVDQAVAFLEQISVYEFIGR